MEQINKNLIIVVLTIFVISPLNAQNQKMDKKTEFEQIFPLGEKNDSFSQYFIGRSYLCLLYTSRSFPMRQMKHSIFP